MSAFAKCVATVAIGVVLLSLAGCSAGGCSSGAGSAEEAAQGLVKASQTADDPKDICRYTARGAKYEQQDVETLAQRYSGYDLSTLTYTVIDQMGSDSTVEVSTDGIRIDTLDATSSQDGQWTIHFGTNYPS